MSAQVCLVKIEGFSLIELMIALVVLTLGLLGVGQLLYVAAASASLARSKDTAAVTAQDKLEFLADLYGRNTSAEDLTPGSHGPLQTQMVNPVDGTVLNRHAIAWTVSTVADPRPGKVPDARLVRVRITPVRAGGAANYKPGLNKTLDVTTIFSPRTP